MNPKTRVVLDSKNASWKVHLGKWRTFAAVGGATLAASTNADAGIVYSGPVDVSLSVPPTGSHNFGTKSFAIGGYKELLVVGNGSNPRRGYAALSFVTGNRALKFALNASGGAAKKYLFGNPIHVLASAKTAPVQTHQPGFIHGSFGPGVVAGYVGFKAPDGDLGWIKVQVSDSGSTGYPNEIAVLGWAYNDVPGGSIFAGQTSNAVPEPSSLALGLLAAGSLGLAALRRAKVSAEGAP
jgi:hypothetical protein